MFSSEKYGNGVEIIPGTEILLDRNGTASLPGTKKEIHLVPEPTDNLDDPLVSRVIFHAQEQTPTDKEGRTGVQDGKPLSLSTKRSSFS